MSGGTATLAVAPRHVDWLLNTFVISGPSEPLDLFRRHAAGAGVIPWTVDFDAMEEDLFHRLAAPPPPQRRSLGLQGARLLASELRAASERRHALAMAQVGRSQVCPFDLHALLPVPAAHLARGPDDPGSRAWLAEHWGTSEPLRHVEEISLGRGAPAGADATMTVRCWSADWTPWQAVRRLRADWAGLGIVARPVYDR